ncbi:MAG: hypothetical protein C4519_11345 [Desulfobacteraceae bacterium]|nr:MAG: hypothetical protein C4519_11345 [Desulfobacteraceae bacterium]
MSIWSFEAVEIADSEDVEARPIYYTPAIKSFLKFEKSQIRIISGLKGTGKTLFLKLVSYHYRRIGGVTLIPTTQLTDRLYSIDYDFSGERAKAWATPERWKHVWRTALSVIILKAIKKEVPTKLLEIFPENLKLSVGAHLTAAIRNRTVKAPDFQELFPMMLDAPLQGINQPVALFVDNIDEAMARHCGYDLYYASLNQSTQSGAHSYDLWLSAQIGFILAVRELTARNSHLKLFGTVRAEAIRDNQSPIAFNLQSMVLDLHYSPLELRGIFQKKLERLKGLSHESFARPSEADVIKAFFPYDVIEHITVVQADGRPYQEDIFDYLRRHTRGRPRELDFIGHALQMIPPAKRTPDQVRDLVRDLSYKFFTFAKNEAVPFWDKNLDILLDNIHSNFINRDKAEKIAEKLYDAKMAGILWNSLFANGLCGAVVTVHPRVLIQRFANHDGMTELSDQDFKSARAWVLHPCVNIATRARRIKYQPNPRNVAGHAYPFFQEARRKHIHVLIGAGRLGFGLVVPALIEDEDTKIIIFARASAKWEPLLGPNRGGMRNLVIQYFTKADQKNPVFNLYVVSDEHTGWQDEIRKSFRRGRCVMLISTKEDSFQYAIRLGDSIGVSVGKDNIESIAERIAATNCKSKVVIGYENDEEGMNKASKILLRKGKVFAPAVVDRICVEREVGEDAITVRAEGYKRITAHLEIERLRFIPPAFTNRAIKEVQTVSDADEFNLIKEKKKRLVNSLHAAAAGLVHLALIETGAKKETADDVLLGLISHTMEIESQLVTIKELMILAILGTLPKSRLSGDDVKNLIHDLNEYGDQALKRMTDGPDAPSRVLKTDIQSLSAKYRRLFKDVESLALEALRSAEVQKSFAIGKNEISERLKLLQNMFLNLLTMSGKKTN